MRTFILNILLVGLLTTALSGCKKESADLCEDVVCLNGGACQSGYCVCPEGFGGTNCQTVLSTTGTALFWTLEDLDYGAIEVTVNGITQNITYTTGSTFPTCSSPASNPVFELEPGQYMYEAHDSQVNWSGTFTISGAGDCESIRLEVNEEVIRTITVYTPNAQYLPITVTLSGSAIVGGSETLTITQAYPSITSCDVVGCANFLALPLGTISLTASSAGATWSDPDVTAIGSCSTVTLN